MEAQPLAMTRVKTHPPILHSIPLFRARVAFQSTMFNLKFFPVLTLFLALAVSAAPTDNVAVSRRSRPSQILFP